MTVFAKWSGLSAVGSAASVFANVIAEVSSGVFVFCDKVEVRPKKSI
jgi:hypothetical protein